MVLRFGDRKRFGENEMVAFFGLAGAGETLVASHLFGMSARNGV
jgi:hypothetical protein